VGFARRVVRKSVRKATPRSVRKAMHPVRTTKNAITPRPVKQLSRAVYTVTNPLGAAENALIGSVLNGGRGSRRKSRSRSSGRSSGTSRPRSSGLGGQGSFVGVRATEAIASQDTLAQLMVVQWERFTAAQRPVAAVPELPDPAPLRAAEWNRLKTQAHFWQRERRAQLRAKATASAEAQNTAAYQAALAHAATWQQQADAWWDALNRGEPDVLRAALKAAFADNTAKVAVPNADGHQVTLALALPALDVVPAKKAHVTPGGKLSSKEYTQTERNQVYAELIGAHLLATLRETWAVAPSVTQVRVLGVHSVAQPTSSAGRYTALFDITVTQTATNWADDSAGNQLVTSGPCGLRRTGRVAAVTTWVPEELPAAARTLLAGLNQIVVVAAMEPAPEGGRTRFALPSLDRGRGAAMEPAPEGGRTRRAAKVVGRS